MVLVFDIILCRFISMFFYGLRNKLKEQEQMVYWLFGIGNLNVYKGFSVILEHQLGREITEFEAYELLIKKHGKARCRLCCQRTEAVVPEKSLSCGG